MMRKILFITMCLFAVSCNERNEIVDPNQARISLTAQNLPLLKEAHYQLWATFFLFNKSYGGDAPTHQGEYVSLGEFKVVGDGSLRSLNGGPVRFALPTGSNPQLLKDIVIAVQTEQSDSFAKLLHEEPGSILIGGAFHGDASRAIADMTISYADAFKSNFSSVNGKCTITCPTSPADSSSGVWFIEAGLPPTAGLKNLPTLPKEWRYEGWVVSRPTEQPPVYYSTGKFLRADSADFDGAGPNRGSDTTRTGFNFPGQDFVQGAFHPNLTSELFSFMVTIEPFPDDSPSPFFLTLLQKTAAPSVGRTFTLQNVLTNSTPTARVIVDR